MTIEIKTKPISTGTSTQVGYQIAFRDNLFNGNGVLNRLGDVLLTKDWKIIHPNHFKIIYSRQLEEGKVRLLAHCPDESSVFTSLHYHGLLPYHSAMSIGYAVLGWLRLQQIEFKLIKCELKLSHEVTEQDHLDPIKNDIFKY